MFPVSDVIPSRSTPYVTVALIVATAVVFVIELRLDAEALQALIRRAGFVPRELAPATLVTSLFLHVGWVHVGGNMLYLWIFGDNVEDRLGHVAYLLFYFACGVGAALGYWFLHPRSSVPMIGASGAVSGVMGAYFVLYPQSRVLTGVFVIVFLDLVEIPAIYFLGIWFLLQLFSGIGSIGADAAHGGTAFWAHVSGFALGAVAGAVLRVTGSSGGRSWRGAGRGDGPA